MRNVLLATSACVGCGRIGFDDVATGPILEVEPLETCNTPVTLARWPAAAAVLSASVGQLPDGVIVVDQATGAGVEARLLLNATVVTSLTELGNPLAIARSGEWLLYAMPGADTDAVIEVHDRTGVFVYGGTVTGYDAIPPRAVVGLPDGSFVGYSNSADLLRATPQGGVGWFENSIIGLGTPILELLGNRTFGLGTITGGNCSVVAINEDGTANAGPRMLGASTACLLVGGANASPAGVRAVAGDILVDQLTAALVPTASPIGLGPVVSNQFDALVTGDGLWIARHDGARLVVELLRPGTATAVTVTTADDASRDGLVGLLEIDRLTIAIYSDYEDAAHVLRTIRLCP